MVSPPLDIPRLRVCGPLIQRVDICHQILGKACQRNIRCTGFYQASYNDLHTIFHSSPECHRGYTSTKVELTGLTSLSLKQLFAKSRDDIISLPEQLHLARRLVKGFLQFYATPWITKNCSSADLHIFGSEEQISNEDLRTLHVTKNITAESYIPVQDSLERNSETMQDVSLNPQSGYGNTTRDIEADALLYGVRNPVLWRLGVFILSIAYWRDIDPTDVVEVRRLADSNRRLGCIPPRFVKIAQQCINCEFGSETDLLKFSLQEAVHEEVVIKLERMISACGPEEIDPISPLLRYR
jgi:hypothetical protein